MCHCRYRAFAAFAVTPATARESARLALTDGSAMPTVRATHRQPGPSMFVTRIAATAALGLSLAGCVSAPKGYWDARLAEMPLAFNYGCRNALDQGSAVNATNYCPPGMPLPPNGVWKPGLSGAR